MVARFRNTHTGQVLESDGVYDEAPNLFCRVVDQGRHAVTGRMVGSTYLYNHGYLEPLNDEAVELLAAVKAAARLR